MLIETDWDGRRCLSSVTDRATGHEYIPLSVSTLYEPKPNATVELLTPVHCKKLNGHMLKARFAPVHVPVQKSKAVK